MLSRVLYGNIYNTMTWNYRDKHMQILYNQGIIKAMNPMIDEQRWWIFLMLYRASK
jgi:predicted phosphatase